MTQPEPPKTQQTISSDVSQPKKPCEHEFRRVSGDTERCQHCGAQRTPFTARGFSFAELALLKRKKSRFSLR